MPHSRRDVNRGKSLVLASRQCTVEEELARQQVDDSRASELRLPPDFVNSTTAVNTTDDLVGSHHLSTSPTEVEEGDAQSLYKQCLWAKF